MVEDSTVVERSPSLAEIRCNSWMQVNILEDHLAYLNKHNPSAKYCWNTSRLGKQHNHVIMAKIVLNNAT